MDAEYEIKVNESFQVEFDSNPTTGFTWKWANEQNVSIVESEGSEYSTSVPVRPGSSGKEIWKFKGKQKGSDTLKFQYSRSFDEISVVSTKTITVKVK
jgi:inhibitor of cysteine peptidase